MIYFTSDTHLGHTNIIEYCSRPFNDVDQMDNHIISEWNSIISPEDVVIHVGDFALKRYKENLDLLNETLSSLKGIKYLVRGNHDSERIIKGDWNGVSTTLNFEYQGYQFVIRHEPFSKIDPSKIYIHGHTHGNKGKWHNGQFDISVEAWDYKPVSIETIITIWKEKIYHKGETNELN